MASGTLITGGGTLLNASTVQASGGTLSFIGGITGTGKLDIAATSTLSLSGSVSSGQEAIFQSAISKLVLGAPTAFAGTIYDFIKGNTIDLSNILASSLTYSGQTLTLGLIPLIVQEIFETITNLNREEVSLS
jgi:hypothetical protein